MRSPGLLRPDWVKRVRQERDRSLWWRGHYDGSKNRDEKGETLERSEGRDGKDRTGRISSFSVEVGGYVLKKEMERKIPPRELLRTDSIGSTKDSGWGWGYRRGTVSEAQRVESET